MSTNDVPGSNPANNDTLRMGCWAEAHDGSYLYVYSTEGDRVVYTMFDTSKSPVVEYRDAMDLSDFEKFFSTSRGDIHKPVVIRGLKAAKELWTWHDKTPFPWDKIITAGASSGPRFASAADTLSAAERVARDLRMRAERVVQGAYDHKTDRPSSPGLRGIKERLSSAAREFLRP